MSAASVARRPMILALSRLAGGLVAASTAIAAMAAPTEFQCPPSITVQAGALAGTSPAEAQAAGLQLFQPESRLWLTGATLYDGPPQEGASLRPDDDRRDRATWSLSGSAGRVTHAACDYGRGLARLVKPMPGTPQRCTAHFGRDPKQPMAVRFSCT